MMRSSIDSDTLNTLNSWTHLVHVDTPSAAFKVSFYFCAPPRISPWIHLFISGIFFYRCCYSHDEKKFLKRR